MHEYSIGGFDFDVTDAGPADGEVIVLLHGYPENRLSWAGVIPLLVDAGYRVLAPDQRGYSPRARPKGRKAYRIDLLVDDVVGLADAAGAERVHVVGHDWGGSVAWAMAMIHPERLHSIASLATPHPQAMLRSLWTSSQLLRSWYMLLFQLPRLPELSLTGPGRAQTAKTLRASGLAADKVDRYLARFDEPGAATAALNWYRGLPFGSRESVGAVQVPTLYVYATGDFALGRKAADLTGRYVQGPYRYELLDGVSHWIPEEVPERVAELVTDHVAAHGPKPPVDRSGVSPTNPIDG